MIPVTYDTADTELRRVIRNVRKYSKLIKGLDALDVYNGDCYNKRINFWGFHNEAKRVTRKAV